MLPKFMNPSNVSVSNPSQLSLGATIANIVLYGFVLSGAVFVVTGLLINSYLFALLLVLVIVRWLRFGMRPIPMYLLFAYGGFILLGVSRSLLEGLPSGVVVEQAAYYMKPAIFFFAGYYFLRAPEALDRLVRFVFAVALVGTLIFVFDKEVLYEATLRRVETKGLDNVGYLIAFGEIPRNVSLLLSPLELGFTLLFISFYLYTKVGVLSAPTFISMMMLVSSFARSAMIAFLSAVSIAYYLRLNLRPRVALVLGGVTAVGVLVAVYWEFFNFVFIEDGSARIHKENILTAWSRIVDNPWGLGIGTSGWPAIGYDFLVYSEGTLLATIIENGWYFLGVYFVLLVDTFVRSRRFLFPLYCGYLLASLMIPIGYSTLFNLLFFGSYGRMVRTGTS